MTNKEAKEILEWELNNFKYTDNEFVEATKVAIKALEERPKGKWIGDTDYESCQGNYEAYKCSECGYGIGWRKHHQLMCQDKIPEEYREYYCPHCGADMRGDV